MENKKNRVLVISFILTLSVITGCTITTTRNQYYGWPDQIQNSNQNKAGSKHVVDTLTNKKIHPSYPNLF